MSIATKTVLIADDEPHIGRLIGFTLRSIGCRLETATTGADAVRIASERHIDLLIIDVEMPGMGGIAAVRKLKEKPEYAALPVILMTGSGDTKLHTEAEQIAVRFLTKPFSPLMLQREVETLLKAE